MRLLLYYDELYLTLIRYTHSDEFVANHEQGLSATFVDCF